MSDPKKPNKIYLSDEFNEGDLCEKFAEKLAVDVESPAGQALENILKRQIADTEESPEEMAFHRERRERRAAIPFIPASRRPN